MPATADVLRAIISPYLIIYISLFMSVRHVLSHIIPVKHSVWRFLKLLSRHLYLCLYNTTAAYGVNYYNVIGKK